MVASRTRSCGFLLGILVFIVGIGFGSKAVQRTQAADSKDAKLKRLLKEKVDILDAIVIRMEKLHSLGEAGFEELYEAHLAKHRAQLELCENDAERIAILEKLLAEAKRRETAIKASRAESSLRIQKAEVDRLEVEIDLERLRIK